MFYKWFDCSGSLWTRQNRRWQILKPSVFLLASSETSVVCQKWTARRHSTHRIVDSSCIIKGQIVVVACEQWNCRYRVPKNCENWAHFWLQWHKEWWNDETDGAMRFNPWNRGGRIFQKRFDWGDGLWIGEDCGCRVEKMRNWSAFLLARPESMVWP